RPSVVAGYLLLPQAHRHIELGELDAAAQAATEAGALALEFRDRDLEALAQSVLGRVLIRQGHVERGLSLLDLSVLTISTEPISPNVAGVVYCVAIANATRIFALDRAREWTGLLTQFCEAQPQLITFSGTCFVHCSEIQQTAGDWSEALRTAERARERGPMPRPAAGHAFYQCAEVKRATGDFVAAEALYAAASEHGYEPQPGLALLRLAQGKVDAAAVAIRRLLCSTVNTQERVGLLPAAVTVLLAAGALDEARALVVELDAAARLYGMDVLRALSAQAWGSLHLAAGRAEAALPPLGAAFELFQRLDAPYLGARVRVELAAACGALGDLDGKNLHLAAARAVFEKLGARHDLSLLAGARTGQGGLSARELEVLRLVACGKTNKTIAAELCLSEKTVDRHVSNIFAKLDVNTRAAATAYAYQHHLA
ncbi:MAG TPA: LuxR C-terminal-related transcriptional regulator, partial [Polyangiaceae bacterium]|nr:LuxR C-terminal-related transcriptional regulator [Polyangiaceae bacterium]